ncbi:hypothetical protein [Nonomuraea sp. LPB2021202275-12-8]|uniref:hypothetical protein n=1 Tax=Nonomuraea sp. LPB2021202275-12-8 TaxID=3120159 RepID=UPI00300D67A3
MPVPAGSTPPPTACLSAAPSRNCRPCSPPGGTAAATELGVQRIHDHDVALANRFRAGLGLEPSDTAIVAVDAPGERLAAAGIRAAVRAAKVRASFHVYNTADDVDRVLEALGSTP